VIQYVSRARKSANLADLTVETSLKQTQIAVDRSVVELVARRIIVLDTGEKTRSNTIRSTELENESTVD